MTSYMEWLYKHCQNMKTNISLNIFGSVTILTVYRISDFIYAVAFQKLTDHEDEYMIKYFICIFNNFMCVTYASFKRFRYGPRICF